VYFIPAVYVLLLTAWCRSNIVPVESLCIQPAKSVWVLYVDAICINFDGNALDAALLAMVAALRNTTLPKARWDEDQERTICRAKNQTKVLENQSTVSMCFGVFDQCVYLSSL